MKSLKNYFTYLIVQRLRSEIHRRFGYLIKIEKDDLIIRQYYSDDNDKVTIVIDGTLGFLLNRPTIKILIPVEYQSGQRIKDKELKELVIKQYHRR